MKTIALSLACQLLADASAVVIEDNGSRVLYPDVDFQGDGDNPFLHLSWEDEGQDFRVECFERDNETVNVAGSSMFLIDEDGEELQVTLLRPSALEGERELSEAIQDDILTRCDGMLGGEYANELKSALCQIVVDHTSKIR